MHAAPAATWPTSARIPARSFLRWNRPTSTGPSRPMKGLPPAALETSANPTVFLGGLRACHAVARSGHVERRLGLCVQDSLSSSDTLQATTINAELPQRGTWRRL